MVRNTLRTLSVKPRAPEELRDRTPAVIHPGPSITMPRLKKVAPFEPSLSRGRRASTAVAMEYPMWVMPVSEFLRLSSLRPHEELRVEGKVVECDPSHTTVFYISHQWTSSNHPDDSTTQLRALQTLLLRMQRGELPETAPTSRGLHLLTQSDYLQTSKSSGKHGRHESQMHSYGWTISR